MAWHIPLALGGPVLHWELVRGARLQWMRFVSIGYAIFLIVQLIALHSAFRSSLFILLSTEERRQLLRVPPWEERLRWEPNSSGLSDDEWSHLQEIDQLPDSEIERQRYQARVRFWGDHLFLVLHQQLLLMLLLIPLMTAGALGHEKERGTLAALFGTEMSAWQIIIGKLIGRLVLLLCPALVVVPAVVMLSVVADIELNLVLLAFAQAAMLTFAVASICLLAAVWTRRTSDAILGCYTVIALIILANLSILADTPLPGWLDPFAVLSKFRGGVAPPEFLPHIALWGGVGLGCLVLASSRLRRVCLGQLEKRPARWVWAFRPRVGDDPIRWRERYVIGLAPLPWLRGVPTWMALLGVFSFSAILAGSAIEAMVRGFFPALRQGDFARAWRAWQHPTGPDTFLAEVSVMGAVLGLVSALVVGVRCGTSVAEEKRRKTWDDLLLSGESIESIVSSKRWGVLQAAIPYVIAYCLPMFALASLRGPGGWFVATIWVAIAVGIMYGVSGVAPSIPDDSEGPSRRTIRRDPPRGPRKAAKSVKQIAPIQGAILIDESSPEMTEEEVLDFLKNEPWPQP